MAAPGPYTPDQCKYCWIWLNDQEFRQNPSSGSLVPPPPGLGSLIKTALEAIGVTPERMEQVLGEKCGCCDRAKKLDQMTVVAKRVVAGKIEGAKRFLAGIFGMTEEEL